MNTQERQIGQLLSFPKLSSLNNGEMTAKELREEMEMAEYWREEMEAQWLEEGEVPYFGLEEYRLFHNFSNLVDEVSVREVMHATAINPDKVQVIPTGYEFISLEAANYHHSSEEALYDVSAPSDVDYVYGDPCLDSSFGIGLLYKGALSAIASAHITEQGNLRIVQLQGAPKPSHRPKANSGLHGDFFWRDSLVKAWMEVAKKLQVATIEIKSTLNNELIDKYSELEEVERSLADYDQVAKRMGFTENKDRDWELDISKWREASVVSLDALRRLRA
jgi:hypothetical protein